MADSVIALRIVFFGVLLNACCNAAIAQTLVDPTRPPNFGPQSPLDGVPTPPSAQAGVNVVVTAKEGVLALYDGKPLRVGSRINGGTVTRIAPDAVFVRDAKGKTARLPLYPDVVVTQTNAKMNAKKTAPALPPDAGARVVVPVK